jgi:hypothetical protein
MNKPAWQISIGRFRNWLLEDLAQIAGPATKFQPSDHRRQTKICVDKFIILLNYYQVKLEQYEFYLLVIMDASYKSPVVLYKSAPT